MNAIDSRDHSRGRSILLEALFTPEWSALYDPVSRERWDVSALLDEQIFSTLSRSTECRDPAETRALVEAGVVTMQCYDIERAEAWLESGWGDALRHYLHTNQLQKLSYENANGWLEDFATMKEKVRQSPIPEATKSYADARKRVATWPTESSYAFRDVLEINPRQRGRKSADYVSLANLLSRVFGVSGRKSLAVTGSHIQKTSPSGGSRHPTEAYVVAFDLEGLDAGVYHFQSENHEVELLQSGCFKDLYMEKVFGLNRRISFEPKVAVVLTSVVERSMHRYRESRSYRVIHFDVGHLLLSCQLVARAEGVPFFSAYSLGEHAAEQLLGIDGLFETAVSQIVFG